MVAGWAGWEAGQGGGTDPERPHCSPKWPQRSSVRSVLGSEGQKDLGEADLWPEAECFLLDAPHT